MSADLTVGALPGNGVLLRPFRLADADDVAAACADPLTQRFLPQLPRPYTRDVALWWVNEGAPAAFAASGAAFAVADPATGRLLGGAGLGRHRADDPGAAEIGYWVAPWARGRGVATAAARALAAHAFNHQVVRLELRTAWENVPSQRVALAAGFARESVARDAGRGADGTRYDQIVWSRLAGDPGTPTPRLLPDLPGSGPAATRTLTDGVISLRSIGPADIGDVLELRNRPDVYLRSAYPVPPPEGHVAQMCARAAARWLAGESALLTIREAGSDRFAGEIGVFMPDPLTMQAMLGYSLDPRWRGRGFTTRAVRLLAGWLFEAGFARLIAGTAPDNAASQRVLQRAGFRNEGYGRSVLPGPPGQPRVDDVMFALLPGEITDPSGASG